MNLNSAVVQLAEEQGNLPMRILVISAVEQDKFPILRKENKKKLSYFYIRKNCLILWQ